MNLKRWRTGSMAVLCGIMLMTAACEKKVTETTGPDASHLSIYLTDAPADYKAVWIDIQKVLVHTEGSDSNGESGWQEVPLTRPGLYNLLDFKNGADTLLAKASLPAGTISQLRLVLGSNNSLTLQDGTKVPLTTPSAQSLNLNTELKAGTQQALVLDFDVALSIIKIEKSGKYLLKPVIRTYTKGDGGGIEGIVLPDSAQAHIVAIMNEDTLSAIPDTTGYYKFQGMKEGAYKLIFSAGSLSGFLNDTISSITVKPRNVTQIDTVLLSKEANL